MAKKGLLGIIKKELKKLGRNLLPLFLAGTIALSAPKADARIFAFSGYAKTATGQPADGGLGYRVLCQKIPPDTSVIVTPGTGGLFGVSRLMIGEFNMWDTVRFKLYKRDFPADSSNYIYIITDTFPGNPGARIYVPEIYTDSSAIPNRAYAISIRTVIAPPGDTARKKCEYWLRKNPSDRDTALSIRGPPWNTADTFHFSLEFLVENANEGDTVDLHIFTNDTTYKDTFVIVKRNVGRFPNDADRPIDTVYLVAHPRIRDVGTARIIAPEGIVDSGQVVVPQALIKNYGNTTETFNTRFKIPGHNYDTTEQLTLQPGESLLVNFANWIPRQRGIYVPQCSTELDGDMNNSNDKAIGVGGSVRVKDLAAILHNIPAIIDTGTVFVPMVKVANLGTHQEEGTAKLYIGPYFCLRNVPLINPGESIWVEFEPWTALQRGNNAITAIASTENDAYINDTLRGNTFVRVLDAAAYAIDAPRHGGIYIIGEQIRPSGRISNPGNVTLDSVYVYDSIFKIIANTLVPVYGADTIVRALQPGEIRSIVFPVWTAEDTGNYLTKLKVYAPQEQNSANNVMTSDLEDRIRKILNNPRLKAIENCAKELGPNSYFYIEYSIINNGKAYNKKVKIHTDQHGNIVVQDILKDQNLVRMLFGSGETSEKAKERWLTYIGSLYLPPEKTKLQQPDKYIFKRRKK